MTSITGSGNHGTVGDRSALRKMKLRLNPIITTKNNNPRTKAHLMAAQAWRPKQWK